jgi:hypothetical protein
MGYGLWLWPVPPSPLPPAWLGAGRLATFVCVMSISLQAIAPAVGIVTDRPNPGSCMRNASALFGPALLTSGTLLLVVVVGTCLAAAKPDSSRLMQPTCRMLVDVWVYLVCWLKRQKRLREPQRMQTRVH